MALQWSEVNDDRCPGCGQPQSESFAMDNAGRYETHSLRCHACAARESRLEALHDNKADMHGRYVTVHLNRAT